ncbi:MAG: ribonuclease III, partial [Chlamydiota bacterium]
MHPSIYVQENFSLIEKRLGYTFKNKELLFQAFIHRSFVNENKQNFPSHNERLEFLGDSVLGLLVAEYLFEKHPDLPEGKLSYLRSFLVDAKTCALFLQKLELDSFLLLGKGERYGEGRGKETIFADAFEAVMGALYLDGGFEAVKKSFQFSLQTIVESLLQSPFHNYKAELQELLQKKYQKIPVYKVLTEEGPEHHKRFV